MDRSRADPNILSKFIKDCLNRGFKIKGMTRRMMLALRPLPRIEHRHVNRVRSLPWGSNV
jgi:hypothetical protein